MEEEYLDPGDAWYEAMNLAQNARWDEVFERLRAGDINVDATAPGYSSFLSVAVFQQNLAAAHRLLMEFKADPNTPGANAVTPLHNVVNHHGIHFDNPAFQAKALAMALLLLTAGADPMRKAWEGVTPYDWSLEGKEKTPKMPMLSELLKPDAKGVVLGWEIDATGARSGLTVLPLQDWRGHAPRKNGLKHAEALGEEAAIIAGLEGVHVVTHRDGEVKWQKLAPHWLEFWQAVRDAQAEHPSHPLYLIDLERVPANELIDRSQDGSHSYSLMLPELRAQLPAGICERFEFLRIPPDEQEEPKQENPKQEESKYKGLEWMNRLARRRGREGVGAEPATLLGWLDQQAARTGSGVYRMESEPVKFFAQAEAIDSMPPLGEAQARLVAARNEAYAAAQGLG